MLDSKLQSLKDHFGITQPTDWQSVSPSWVLSLDGIGPATLDYLRLNLAARGLTLKDDRTPEYWQQHLKHTRVGGATLGNEEISDDVDRGVICPFTVLIDTAEQHPFTFQGFYADAADKHRPLVVATEFTALGRHPDSLGDYSLSAGCGRCHVERKSLQDAHGTILGWDGRRERFERELENLSQIEAGLVVVESSFCDLIRLAPARGKRTAAQNAKALFRSVIAFQQDFRVPWQFCENRRLAEQVTFRWLERWHRNCVEDRKAEEKRLKKMNGRESVEQELAAL